MKLTERVDPRNRPYLIPLETYRDLFTEFGDKDWRELDHTIQHVISKYGILDCEIFFVVSEKSLAQFNGTIPEGNLAPEREPSLLRHIDDYVNAFDSVFVMALREKVQMAVLLFTTNKGFYKKMNLICRLPGSDEWIDKDWTLSATSNKQLRKNLDSTLKWHESYTKALKAAEQAQKYGVQIVKKRPPDLYNTGFIDVALKWSGSCQRYHMTAEESQSLLNFLEGLRVKQALTDLNAFLGKNQIYFRLDLHEFGFYLVDSWVGVRQEDPNDYAVDVLVQTELTILAGLITEKYFELAQRTVNKMEEIAIEHELPKLHV